MIDALNEKQTLSADLHCDKTSTATTTNWCFAVASAGFKFCFLSLQTYNFGERFSLLSG